MGEINRYILHLRILDILRIAVDSKRADGAVHTLRIGIDDGDLVVVRRQLEATSGQIVAALVDGGSTLKRLRYNSKNDQYELHPENKEKNYPPVEGNHISIQGVAVKILKSPE